MYIYVKCVTICLVNIFKKDKFIKGDEKTLIYTYSFKVENGIFKEVIGDNCTLISDTQAKIADWDCVITGGDLVCVCVQTLNNSSSKLKYVIRKNGTTILTLHHPGNKRAILKKRCLATHNKFNLNGIVTLSCGNIHKRFARFEHIKK